MSSSGYRNGFDENTPFGRIDIRPNSGQPNTAGTYEIDNVVLGTEAQLSTGNFSKNNISVYPIPAKNTLVLNGIIQGETINIIDVTGSIIGTRHINSSLNLKSIDVSTLSSGLYFLQTESGNIKKFIKE
ncbi:T9SS type A sorting domain-containing protein [Joostella atrarenae]|uniref:T9SS type A sorting domain-containing protein n=1 Tax=Joostella atrarenae TaxID=679257 RepID=A0ABS9J2L7_9FLAO|nr:T9SS type A sorting domain-containing protein [Joostella atrarenae]